MCCIVSLSYSLETALAHLQAQLRRAPAVEGREELRDLGHGAVPIGTTPDKKHESSRPCETARLGVESGFGENYPLYDMFHIFSIEAYVIFSYFDAGICFHGSLSGVFL